MIFARFDILMILGIRVEYVYEITGPSLKGTWFYSVWSYFSS